MNILDTLKIKEQIKVTQKYMEVSSNEWDSVLISATCTFFYLNVWSMLVSSPLSLLRWALYSVSMRGNSSLDGHLNKKSTDHTDLVISDMMDMDVVKVCFCTF